MEATKAADCSTIIKHFEKHMLSAPTEASILGALTPQLAAIQVNATSAASNLRNLADPPIPSQVVAAFDAKASTGDEPAVTMPISVLDSKSVDVANWQEWLQDC